VTLYLSDETTARKLEKQVRERIKREEQERPKRKGQ
jgi:hypothetical protein